MLFDIQNTMLNGRLMTYPGLLVPAGDVPAAVARGGGEDRQQLQSSPAAGQQDGAALRQYMVTTPHKDYLLFYTIRS